MKRVKTSAKIKWSWKSPKVRHCWSRITADVWDPAGIESVTLTVIDHHRSVTLTEPSWSGRKNSYDKYMETPG